jgi:HSP20 family molecular chaperone IbpA
LRRGEDLASKPALTVREAAELSGFSPQTITVMFENEPGVIILERPEKMHKRRYRSIRIPRGVYSRVMLRITK